MRVYFNEFDPGAVAWLRELGTAGLIPAGDVDVRSIAEVRSADVAGYRAVHLFAGIGGWAYALALAGWPADRPVWTGSCPCQPFSSAGRRKGEGDPRHLWPEVRRLVAECRPATVFGEQVASKDGRRWYAGVRTDLEALGYAVGAADLCSPGTATPGEGWVRRGDSYTWEPVALGAPHIRQRLYWVADSDSGGRPNPRPVGDPSGRSGVGGGRGPGGLADPYGERRGEAGGGDAPTGGGVPAGRGPTVGVADAGGERPQGDIRRSGPGEQSQPASDGVTRRLGDTVREGPQGRGTGLRSEPGHRPGGEPPGSPGGSRGGFWSEFDVVPCRDGKARRVEPGSFPLADGIPGRVGLLRGYGNAIDPHLAAAFVSAFLETE